jgi:hypothetical protein
MPILFRGQAGIGEPAALVYLEVFSEAQELSTTMKKKIDKLGDSFIGL